MKTRPKRIALLFDMSIGYCRDVVEGIQSYVRKRKNWICFDAIAGKRSLRPLREWEPDGMIVHLFDAGFAAEIVKMGVPIVNTTSTLIELQLPLVEADHKKVGELAAEFFLARGYTRFGFYGSRRAHFSRSREESFKHSLEASGYQCVSCYEEFLPRRIERESWKYVEEKTEMWLNRLTAQRQPVGILASNDVPARFLSHHCHNLGIRIPRDLALLSVDNDRYECRLASPTLSSIELPSFEIGRRAAAMLDRLISGKRVAKLTQWLPPVRVVTRGSTEATAVSDEDVRTFFRWLLDGYGRNLSAEQLCAEVGIGRRTLERKLHHLLGTTIGQELRKRRIEVAKQMLLETEKPIHTIAVDVGFSSSERFATVFKETVRMTPTAYRIHREGLNTDQSDLD